MEFTHNEVNKMKCLYFVITFFHCSKTCHRGSLPNGFLLRVAYCSGSLKPSLNKLPGKPFTVKLKHSMDYKGSTLLFYFQFYYFIVMYLCFSIPLPSVMLHQLLRNMQ
jgi:hypothetical protein